MFAHLVTARGPDSVRRGRFTGDRIFSLRTTAPARSLILFASSGI